MKTILRSLATGVAGIFGLLAAAAPAQAATLFLNFSNDLVDGPAYVRVDITDAGGGTTWNISFDALTPPFSAPAAGGNFGIDSVGFMIPTSTATIGSLPSNWLASIDTNPAPPPQNQDGFGDFDVVVEVGPQGNRQDPLTFTVTFAVAQLDGWWEEDSRGTGGGWWIAAHVAGFNTTPCGSGSCTSAWFATADNGFPPTGLPEPGGLLIVVTAMGMLALFLRRRGTA